MTNTGTGGRCQRLKQQRIAHPALWLVLCGSYVIARSPTK